MYQSDIRYHKKWVFISNMFRLASQADENLEETLYLFTSIRSHVCENFIRHDCSSLENKKYDSSHLQNTWK